MLKQISVVAVTVAVLALGAIAQEDTINMRDGSKRTGKVLDWDLKNVEVGVGGSGSTRIKAEDVASVQFEGVPRDMKDADAAFSGGRSADAVEKYKLIIDNKKARKPLRQDAFWKTAQAQISMGKFEDAAATMKSMLADDNFPMSRYLVEADESISQCFAWAGKHDDAVKFTTDEETRVGKFGIAGLGDKLRLLRARAYLAKGDLGKAQTEATALAGGAGAAAGDAKVVLGTIALAGEKNDEAERLFREAMASSQTPAVRASCFAGLGQVLRAKATKTKKSDDFKEALLCYLRPVVMYQPDQGGDSGAYEASLFGAAVCFMSIGELEKDADKQKVNNARARENFRKLLENYPQSQYAAEAKERLGRIGG